MSERLTVHFISLADPKRTVEDPALAALMEKGWTVVSHFVVERAGMPEMAFVLAPPEYEQSRNQLSTKAVMIGSLIGTLVGSCAAALISSFF